MMQTSKTSPMGRRCPRLFGNGMRLFYVAVAGLALAALVAAGSADAQVPSVPPIGGLDCNGLSPVQQLAVGAPRGVCADVKPQSGQARAEDNGTYIGHDEPMVTFYSVVPGSANNVQWEFVLPKENPLPATQSFENFLAFWFGMALCDPNSVPFIPCTPNSDANGPNFAGSAVLELQFYPSGSRQLPVEFSCDIAKWCAALNIFSLTFNNFCFEPWNFALIQTDGVPVGPPGPGTLAHVSFVPTAKTLLMNQGDRIRVTIKDTPDGLLTLVEDLTSGKSGFMVASAANGFQNTDPVTCATTAFSFHPEFSTATPDNISPWAADRLNVSFSMEIGHFEPRDNDNPNVDDALCFPASTITGPLVAGCYFEDSDFDGTSYRADWPDGTKANAKSLRIKSSRGQGIGPLSASKNAKGNDVYINPFPVLQFLTDGPASDPACFDSFTPVCAVPQTGAAFYPFYAVSTGDPQDQPASCALLFGNFSGPGINNFGGTAQYGTPDIFRDFQVDVGPIQLNPCLPVINQQDQNQQ
jgi:hypothetical protein